MGTLRNGARTFLNLMRKACQLSRLPGFATGVRGILGSTNGDILLSAFADVCAIVDELVVNDNWYNQLDTQDDDGLGEDGAPA